jgi:hypothetical protein
MNVINTMARLSGWVLIAGSLIAAGYALDGITETGHHALLILGGMWAGAGISNEWRNRG